MPKRHPDHVPMRTCAVCRQPHAKREMTRVVRGLDGTVAIDPSGKAAGRGTYVCDDPACHDSERLAAAVQHALSATVAPGALELEVTNAPA